MASSQQRGEDKIRFGGGEACREAGQLFAEQLGGLVGADTLRSGRLEDRVHPKPSNRPNTASQTRAKPPSPQPHVFLKDRHYYAFNPMGAALGSRKSKPRQVAARAPLATMPHNAAPRGMRGLGRALTTDRAPAHQATPRPRRTKASGSEMRAGGRASFTRRRRGGLSWSATRTSLWAWLR